MNDEAVLWKYYARRLAETLGRTTAERLIAGVILLATIAGAVTLFFTIGQFAAIYEVSYRWASIGLAFVFCAGFFGYLRPLRIQQPLLFLPISHQTITWNSVAAGLRFPILVGLAVMVPYFVGNNRDWFYSTADFVVLTLGTIAVLTAGYLAAVAAALGIRTVTHHTFIRLLAIIATLILALEFLVGTTTLITAIERTLVETNRVATFLLTLGSLGVAGVSVALIELCEPLPSEHRLHRFWPLLQRTRNLRTAFSQLETALFQTLLSVLRNPGLHFKLVLLLLFFAVFQSILVATVPQYPSTIIALHAITLGIAGYLITFTAGQNSVKSATALFFVPVDTARVAIGSYLGSMIVFGVFVSLFSSSNPLGLLATLVIAGTTGTMAFLFGRRDATSQSTAGLTWILILLALPTIFAVVIGSLIDTATVFELTLTALLWGCAYILVPLLFGQGTRTRERLAIQ